MSAICNNVDAGIYGLTVGNWPFAAGRRYAKCKLTDDHIDRIAGKRDQLSGKIQEAYGIGKDEAEKQIKDFEESNKDYKP